MISEPHTKEPKTCKVTSKGVLRWVAFGRNADPHLPTNLCRALSRSFPVKVLGEPCGKPVVPSLPPVQNRCLNRKECERGS